MEWSEFAWIVTVVGIPLAVLIIYALLKWFQSES